METRTNAEFKIPIRVGFLHVGDADQFIVANQVHQGADLQHSEEGPFWRPELNPTNVYRWGGFPPGPGAESTPSGSGGSKSSFTDPSPDPKRPRLPLARARSRFPIVNSFPRFVVIAFVTVLGPQTPAGFPEEPQSKGAEPAGNERQLATLRGHTGWVTGAAFSPDGQRLASCDSRAIAKVWDVASGRALVTVTNHGDGSWSVAYSPDGRHVLTAGAGGRLWDAHTGRLVQSYPPPIGADWLESGPLQRRSVGHGGRIEVVGFSPDGKRALTGGPDGRVIVWDVASGESLLTLKPSEDSGIHAAAFSPDGSHIAIGNYAGKTSLWDASSGHQVLTITGHTNAIESLAYFPDGRRIVTVSYDQTARIWDTRDGRELRVFRGHQGPVMAVAVSPDGRRVVTGGTDGSARLWDAETSEEQLVLRANREPIDAVAFSPDGERVATTSLDRTVRIWDVTSGAQAPQSGAVIEARLESDYLPLPIRLIRDPAHREIRSFRIVGRVPAAGDGEGEVWLDTRPAELNVFGDVQRRVGPNPAPIRVELRYLATGASTTDDEPFGDSPASAGFRSYELVLPGGALSGSLRLVLGTVHLGPHRLLVSGSAGSEERLQQQGPVYRFRPGSDVPERVPPPDRRPQPAPSHILPLQGVPPITSALPDAPLGDAISLSGYYTGSDGRIRRLGITCRPGGAGSLALDPNFITFDYFGEAVSSTLVGYQPHEIALKPAEDIDPSGQRRRLYWAVSQNPNHTNRVAVVLGRTEAEPHRVLLYRGDQVSFIVPVFLAERRRHEVRTAEFAGLSTGEQQAVAELRQMVGYGFHCRIETNHVVELNFTGESARVPPEGLLVRLPHLRSIQFAGGRFAASALADLDRLPWLKTLWFSSAEFQPDGFAGLKELDQLEFLTFRDCRGITDDQIRHLAGLTNLKRLSFYTEEMLRRPPGREQCLTDAGLAHLRQLTRLEHLDLFGHDLSDASAPILAGMTELEELALSGHGFTDAGLNGLAGLQKLYRLRLFGTAVTAEGVAALRSRLPQLEAERMGLEGHD
jgi:WD40 repeat protein